MRRRILIILILFVVLIGCSTNEKELPVLAKEKEEEMSWRDDFDDGSLDSTKFGTSVAGDGAVAESGGTVNITMGEAVANAAIVYLKDALNTAGEFAYTFRHKMDGTIKNPGNAYFLQGYDGTPAVAEAAVLNANIKFGVSYSAGNTGITIFYKDSGGAWQYWTGSGWSTSATYFPLNPAFWIDVSFIVRGSKFRISVRAFGDTKSIAESAWLPFSSLNSYTTLRLYWGDPYTDYYYITSMKTEYVIYSDETKVWTFYNGRTDAANTYKVGRAISFDGGEKYFRDPTTPIIDVIADESNVKDPWLIKVGSTYYLFVAALMSGGDYSGKWRVRYSTCDDLETWINQGYITTPGAASSFDEKGHRFPVVTHDGSTWRLYIACQDGSDVTTIGYFYGANLASLTNYASNPVIDVGGGGAWNDGGLTPTSITASGGTISLYAFGLRLATSKWECGVWTSTDWINWSPDAGNPTVARDSGKQTSGSNISIGNVTISVSDSTIFENDDPVIIGDSVGYRHSNRVLSKPDSTHITLYYPSPHNYITPTISAYNGGSVGIEGLDPDNQANRALGCSFQASVNLLETSAWWEYSAGWLYKPLKTPPLSLGCVWDTVSTENLKWIHNGITLSYTLVVDNLSHANSLGAPALTQVHNLAVANLSHAQLIENVLLSQVHLLAVEALSHGHSISGLSLSQIHQLAVNPLNHAHGIGGLNLTQVHYLLVQDLAHAHSIENVDVIEAVLLVIQDLIHSHSLGTVTLSQNSLLIIQSLLHTHTVEGFLRLIQTKKVIPENFGYQKLNLQTVPGAEGAFSYNKISLTKSSNNQEGSFAYQKLRLKKVAEEQS